MFEIVGREEQVFEQWEQGAKVSNPCMKAGDEVVFRNASGATAVMIAREESGQVVCDVPNKLLQMCCNILVDLEQGNDRHTECRTTFTVNPAQKPVGYKCVDNSVPDTRISFNDLKDKPFGEEMATLFDQTVELPFVEGMPIGMLQMEADLMQIGSTATVTFDGVAYECDVVEPMPETKAIGNFGLIGEGEDNGMPFCVMIMQGVVMICGQVGTHSLKIESLAVKTIDDKYLPRMSFVVRLIDEGAGIYADRTFAEIYEAHISGKVVMLSNCGYMYSLSLCIESLMRFTGFVFGVGTSSASLTVNQVDITNDDAVTFISATFNGVKN